MMPSPISQSAWAAVCPRERCFTREPKTSENDSFRAPDCTRYRRPAVNWVTPCVSSWAITSRHSVKPPRLNIWPSPSPYTIWAPFQNALS